MRKSKKPTSAKKNTATIVARNNHIISRHLISKNALKVLKTLHKNGYQAYLVGGGVRDLLLEHTPKDFDVVTDAHPEQIREIFRNCRLIGRRFKLAHVYFRREEIIEVSTFRANCTDAKNNRVMVKGRIIRDNVYGTIEEDVWRRDFTINALMYNIADYSIVDYVDGLQDLNNKQLRLIGKSTPRYIEDPVRLLRAIRFSQKLGFTFHPETETPLYKLGKLLQQVSPSRLSEEVLKLFMYGHAYKNFIALQHYQILEYLFPTTVAALNQNEDGNVETFLHLALKNSDHRYTTNIHLSPGFLYAVLLWYPLKQHYKKLISKGEYGQETLEIAMDKVIKEQNQHAALQKRFTRMSREIWTLQKRLTSPLNAKQEKKLMANKYFRAAYDFLLLRVQSGEAKTKMAWYWTEKQQQQHRTSASL